MELVRSSLFIILLAVALSRFAKGDNVVDCEVQTVVVDCGDQNKDSIKYRCLTEEEQDGQIMAYDLPGWITTKFQSAFESRPTNYIRLHDATLSRSYINMYNQQNLRSKPLLLPESQVVADAKSCIVEFFSKDPFSSDGTRRLAPTTGTSTVLMVRVSTNDAVPAISASTMSERAFGSTDTLESTFENCSFGKLKLKKATSESGGVVEISINANVKGARIFDLENLMITALQNKVGDDLNAFDHIIYCVPKGSYFSPTSPGWVAYAYIGSRRSFFNDESCGHLSKLTHEIGHNLGLRHSGDGNSEYGDESDIMSYARDSATYPIRCFNSAKNWKLGWYSDKSRTVNVNSRPWKGRLYGYVDYPTAPGVVLLNIGDLFLQYNKIANMNRDMLERQNQVDVTRDEGSMSAIVAGLDMDNGSTTVRKFAGNRHLVIEVCDFVQPSNHLDYYEVSIRFADQTSCCGRTCPVPQPVPSPTRAPTRAPTFQTVVVAPTRSPTSSPSPPPTPFPTRRPTLFSTTPPTPRPTSKPVVPTPDPTGIPSQSPTPYPTPLSSESPTQSQSPSALPTSELTCDDHPDAKFPTDDVYGYERCIWLAARPAYQQLLCVPSHPAYKICEETCGSCTDDCEDNTNGETFEHHGIDRPCLWLSLRLSVQREVCVAGHEAMDVCPETCGTCDGGASSRQ